MSTSLEKCESTSNSKNSTNNLAPDQEEISQLGISGHWYITNVCSPNVHEDRLILTNWIQCIHPSPWIIGLLLVILICLDAQIIGQRRGDSNNMLLFNRIMCPLDLVEIPLKRRAYTWSNMKYDPVLVKLDGIFTNTNWTTSFPTTLVPPS
jgi:hypothetical protein